MSLIPEWLMKRATPDRSYGVMSNLLGGYWGDTSDALISLLYPKAMPLALFVIGSYGTLSLAAFIKRKIGVDGWRWYFRWPTKLAIGATSFLIIAVLLESLTDDSYDKEEYQRQQEIRQIRKQEVQRKKDNPPEPLNQVFITGTGLERKFIHWEWNHLDSDWEFPQGSGLRWVGRSPYVKYNRNSPHWVTTNKRRISG